MTRPLFIHNTGVACPLGLSGPAAAAAMRAGIQRFAELPYRNDDGTVLRGSRLDALGPTLSARERWLGLAARALDDLGRQMRRDLIEAVPILMLGPSERHDPEPLDIPQILRDLQQQTGWTLSPSRVQVFRGGSPFSLRLLQKARTLAETSPVVVCASDSLTHAHALATYASEFRLLTERNTDGFIPGEAAVAMLLSSSNHRTLGAITGLGFGEEPGTLDNDTPLRAHGLSAAAQQALNEAGLSMSAMQFRITDATGESYFFKEQALMVTRVLRERLEALPLWTTGSSVGHVGGVASFFGVASALHRFARGGAPGRLALVCASDSGASRACAALHCGGHGR